MSIFALVVFILLVGDFALLLNFYCNFLGDVKLSSYSTTGIFNTYVLESSFLALFFVVVTRTIFFHWRIIGRSIIYTFSKYLMFPVLMITAPIFALNCPLHFDGSFLRMGVFFVLSLIALSDPLNIIEQYMENTGIFEREEEKFLFPVCPPEKAIHLMPFIAVVMLLYILVLIF